LSVLNPPENSTFTDNGDGTGTFDYTPDYFQAGVDTVVIVATDEIDPEIQNFMPVYIIVYDVNRPPVLDPVPDTTVGDGFMLTIPLNAIDPDSTIPTFFERDIPDSASYVDNGDGTAIFSWRPRFEDIGVYVVTFGCYDQMDSTLADSQFVTIEVVLSSNHPPIFDTVPDQEVHANDTLDVLITASDFENDPLTITVGEMPSGMTFADSGNGRATLHWVPESSQGGDWNVDLTVVDNGGLSDTTSVNIHVVTYLRGDCNGSGEVNIADVVHLYAFLKGVGPPPIPMEAGDVNASGEVNIADVVYLYAYLKGTGPPPPPAPPGNGGGEMKVIGIGEENKPYQAR
jgi:hypothetical protein